MLLLNPTSAIDIDAKGEIHQNGQMVGKLSVVEFAETAQPEKLGNAYFKVADPNPKLASAAEVHQGSLESANVPVAESAVRLVSVMRQFEMLQRAISLGADMDKRSIEEVARIGS